MGTIFPVQVVLYHVVDFTTILCNNIFFAFAIHRKMKKFAQFSGENMALLKFFAQGQNVEEC